MAKTVVFELDNVVIVRDDQAPEAKTELNIASYPIVGLPKLVENWQLTDAEKSYVRRASFLTARPD